MSNETKSKPAIEWLNPLGLAAAADMIVDESSAINNVPGANVTRTIERIQQDARHAAMMEAAEIVLREYPPITPTDEINGIQWAPDLTEDIAAMIKKAIDNPRP